MISDIKIIKNAESFVYYLKKYIFFRKENGTTDNFLYLGSPLKTSKYNFNSWMVLSPLKNAPLHISKVLKKML